MTATATRLVAGHIPSLARIAHALEARDGAHHVAGHYYASAADAAAQRALQARRMRSDALRGVPGAIEALAALQAPVCVWCGGRVRGAGVPVGGRVIHAGRCERELGAALGVDRAA